ncbi:MAG: restriction endonuclease subunit S [Ignavibacteria bacterium]|nr:restriction endonuclease subunit S [Ignavibacteria bacterium]
MNEIIFKNFIKLQRGFDLPKVQMIKGEYPVIGSTTIIGYHNEYKVDSPGVITGRSGSLGFVQFVKKKYWPHNTSLWVKDFKGNDPKYVYYFLKVFGLERFNSGAGVPTLNRNDLDNYEINIHEIKTQQKIASILSAYDDLIENNTHRIKILEEMAQTIYKEWFVNFRFPDHEKVKSVVSPLGKIPEGWEVKNLVTEANVDYGYPFNSSKFCKDPSGKPVIRIRDIKNNKTQTFTFEEVDEKYKVRNGDIIIGMDGDFFMGKWAGGEAWLNQRNARMRPKGKVSKYYLYHCLVEPINFYDSTIVGTTVAHLSKRDFDSIKILVPHSKILEKISKILDPIYEEEIVLLSKNEYLRKTRDLLLPKLMSGEVEV